MGYAPPLPSPTKKPPTTHTPFLKKDKNSKFQFATPQQSKMFSDSSHFQCPGITIKPKKHYKCFFVFFDWLTQHFSLTGKSHKWPCPLPPPPPPPPPPPHSAPHRPTQLAKFHISTQGLRLLTEKQKVQCTGNTGMKEHTEAHDRILKRQVVPENGVFTWHCK